jgi:hypothetical protein
LTYFHRQHPLCVRACLFWIFGKGDSADSSAASRPRLNFDDNFASEFPGCREGFIGAGRRAPARDLEPIRGKDGFALILVKSGHDCVLFRMKTPNVQPA